MNVTGISAQDNQKLQSQKIQNRETIRDSRLKTFWKARIDDCNTGERAERLHVNNHRDTLESTRAFHVNRNSMHTWRHTTAVNFRANAYRQKQERFEAQAIKKMNQTDSFIKRRTRLLVEMAGDERAKREIVLRDTRASTMTDLNAYRKANLRYCGDPKWG